MTMILPALFALMLVAGVAVIAVGLTRNSQVDVIGDRLNQFTERAVSLEDLELQQPFFQRVIVPTGKSILVALGKYGPKQSAERLKVSLQTAGNPGNITPLMFSGLRIVLAAVLFIVFGFVTLRTMDFLQAMLYTMFGVVIGYLLPGIWLGQQIKKRKHGIVKSLPDALDLLTIAVEAGLAFDSGIQRVAEKWDNELSKEFRRMLGDMRLGRTRRDSLKDMATRTGVDDVQTFTAAIIQADQLGVSMSKILRIQSDQMRIRRRQRAEEMAQKAPIKMLFPMVFLIFPALFVVILGPAVPRIMTGLGGV
ncbi:MAG: type II secretion system F family protein [Chloroflexales bacterium]|nr:type II secretion system F family protein [Chloroflexales bacterium]